MRVTPKHLLAGSVAVAALASLFALLGVYDSDRMPIGERFLFWACAIGVGIGTAGVTFQWISAPLQKWPTALQIAVLSGVSSIPVLLVLLGYDTGFKTSWSIGTWLFQYCLTLIIASVIISGVYIILKAVGLPDAEAQFVVETGKNSIEGFLKRLPLEFQDARLYALSSEDHYLRVHTDRGEELILMRLADAVRELDAAAGMQTHRSWWVARDGIAKISNFDGKQTLTLKSGATALVSRSRKSAFREEFSNYGG